MSQYSARRRVVITGYGMITPLGKNSRETFANASHGRSGLGTITAFDPTGLPCQVAGEVEDGWLEGLEPIADPELEKFSSRAVRLMRMATQEAAAQAQLDQVANRQRIGVSLGFHGENPAIEEIASLQRFYDGAAGWDMRGLLEKGGYSCGNFFRRKPDAVLSVIAGLFGCRGATLSVASACAAGAQAIGEASRMIRAGQCDVMLAGGCEASINFLGFVGFVLLKALVEKYSTPEKASRPFDRKRNGFVMAEGAGVLVIEELEHARSRRVPILGEILGYGASADAFRITDPHPKGEGAVLAMRAALADASLAPDAIDYINAHGTSTAQNDLTETLAIKRVFGERARDIPVSSNKSMLGHPIAAAGAVECILTLMGMEHSLILPTINYEFPDPKCDLDYVPNQARPQEHRRALSNSFGFGGQNGCLCIGRFDE